MIFWPMGTCTDLGKGRNTDLVLARLGFAMGAGELEPCWVDSACRVEGRCCRYRCLILPLPDEATVEQAVSPRNILTLAE